MKEIENILASANIKSDAALIKSIERQLDLSNHKMEIEGISLINIRDLLNVKYTDEMLRNSGYILTLAQFKADAEKYLSLAQKDSILYQEQLMRLYRSYKLFIENYPKGNISNKEVTAEITHEFSKVILALYESTPVGNEVLMEPLRVKIEKMMTQSVPDFIQSWYDKNLKSELGQEFSESIAKKVLVDWQDKRFDEMTVKSLQEEKNKINSVEAILAFFQEKKLPAEVQNKIQDKIISEILTGIQADKITHTSALGAAINYLRQTYIKNDNLTIINSLLGNWQNKQVTSEVAVQLEKCIKQVIVSMRDDLESSLTKEFDLKAVGIFLEKQLIKGYDNHVIEQMKQNFLNFAKVELSPMAGKESALPKCRDAILQKALFALHASWVKGELSTEENSYIEKHVFHSVKQLGDNLKETVSNQNNLQSILARMAQMETKIVDQSREIQSLKDQIRDNSVQRNAVPSNDVKVASSGFFKLG